MRWMTAVALAVAMGLSFTMVGSGEAEAKKKASVAKSKSCKATTIDGKKVSFRCKASETCCYDGLMAKGNCVPAGQVCF
jgi:hypothetical protein